jgi:two-component sensor histidine kinase
VHDLIHQSAASDQVHAASLLRALCAELERSSATPIEFKDEGASPIALQAAVPLMLAGNELITNAIKHAHGKVSVFCRRDAEEVVVQVRDDGDGLPEGFQPDATRRFGMRMVQALTSQIGARFSVLPSAQGAAFEIRLPALEESAA